MREPRCAGAGVCRSRWAIRLLLIGPEYEQFVIKTERGAANLRWICSRELTGGEIAKYREIVGEEERAFQVLFAQTLEEM